MNFIQDWLKITINDQFNDMGPHIVHFVKDILWSDLDIRPPQIYILTAMASILQNGRRGGGHFIAGSWSSKSQLSIGTKKVGVHLKINGENKSWLFKRSDKNVMFTSKMPCDAL